MTDLLCPSKKLRLKANSKPWIDSETISAIRRRDKLFKKYKKSGLETDKDHFRSAKMALQKAISKKKKSFFQEKIEKNANNSKELWKAFKSLGIKSGKVNQSKIALKNDGAIQFEPMKNANIFKDFYSDLAGTLVRKLPVALNKFNNNSTKQYYMNIEKSCHNFELCSATLETIKKILACLDSSKAPGLDKISLKFLKDGTEVLALPLCNLVNLSIKQSLFHDQYKIAKLNALFKKLSKNDPKDYRPISLLPIVTIFALYNLQVLFWEEWTKDFTLGWS